MAREKRNNHQLPLFEWVKDAYTCSSSLTNEELYSHVADRAGMTREDMGEVTPIGKARAKRSPLERKIRWYQQTLKHMGLLEKTEGERGLWQLTQEGKHRLRHIKTGYKLLAFSTDIGLAIWGNGEDVFNHLDAPIALCLTSPPYCLREPRAYGNPPETEYIDFICRLLEPIIRNLKPGEGRASASPALWQVVGNRGSLIHPG